MLPGYNKVNRLGHRHTQGLLEGNVVVQEKVDGSQFSFGLIDGVPRFRSKGAEVYAGQGGQFEQAVQELLLRASKMSSGLVYRGECLTRPKHNVLAYDRRPTGCVMLFDIEDTETGRHHSPAELAATAADLALEAVPCLYTGPGSAISQEMMGQWLQATSILGGATVEGFVIKRYDLVDPLTSRAPLVGKVVREEFRELNQKGPAAPVGPNDIVGKLGHKLRSPARWEKAIGRARDAGTLLNSEADIGPLLRSIQDDIWAEEEEMVKTALLAWAKKGLSREAVRGFPEWYKGRLNQAGE